MQSLFEVILPVFLIIGFGYFATWRKWISDEGIDSLMRFAQGFAVPLLLFTGISRINLEESFHAPLLVSFYAGALTSGAVCLLAALYLFRRPLMDAVAIGFIGLFSNTMLLGIPITERAFGAEALSWNYAIIAIHAPLLYAVGITAMEIAKTRGMGLSIGRLLRQIANAVLHNPLIIGILCGWVVNVGGIKLPTPFWDAVTMINRSAIPVALFGLGGILLRYKPEGDVRVIAFAVTMSLILHPAVTYGLAHFVFQLDMRPLRSATLSAAMPPGVNAYLFANMYGVAKRVSASSVLFATALSTFTVWVWLAILP